jgi:xanthine dehydrogenase YagR molybdenum-binding subunit
MSNHQTAPASRVLGQPIDRIDGPLKVRGAAPYAYEHASGSETAYGFVLGAAIAYGRIAAIDTSAAEAASGVLAVMTHRNAPAQANFGPPKVEHASARPRPVLSDDRVRFYDEPVALVVAESFEAARAAASLIEIEYLSEHADFELEGRIGEAYDPGEIQAGHASDSVIGDPEAALAEVDVKIDATYRSDFQHHAPLEPHAAMATWNGDSVVIHCASQSLANACAALAATLGIPAERVRVLSPYIGGGFGSKTMPHSETVLAALAARELGRPVKVALTRQQMFANAGHRPAMHQHIRLGAMRDGRLMGFAYDVTMPTARMEEYCEQTAAFARALYAAPNRATRHRLVPIDVRRGEVMRAPGEAPGLLAFECAMDELAAALGMDPVELRIANEPERDPELGVPFSTRRLVECLREGAARFGWEARRQAPGMRREGRKLIGHGMAACIRQNYLRTAAARVTMDRDAKVVVETDMTDIGNGSYTIFAQIVAEELGVPLSDIEVRLGDSQFPVSAGSAGSWGAASSGTAITNACRALRVRIVAAERASEESPFRGVAAADIVFEHGMVRGSGVQALLVEIAAVVAKDGLSAEGDTGVKANQPLPTYKEFSQHSYGAHFAEVEVDADTAEVRVRRMLGVFDVGRVLNAKLARSQLLGGMLWGVGSALLEGSELDPRYGAFMQSDLAQYHVMAHADVPEIEALFLDGYDDKANPIGSKGLGELGICGSGAAVANAVYNATGARVRSFPITVDRLLAAMSSMAP